MIDDDLNSLLFCKIVPARICDFKRSLEFVYAIKDKWAQALALCGLAPILAKAGERTHTKAVVDQALAAMEAIEGDEKGGVKLWLLSRLALSMAEAREQEIARDLVDRMLALTETMNVHNSEED